MKLTSTGKIIFLIFSSKQRLKTLNFLISTFQRWNIWDLGIFHAVKFKNFSAKFHFSWSSPIERQLQPNGSQARVENDR